MGYYDVSLSAQIPQPTEPIPIASGYGQLGHILDLADNEPLFETLKSYNKTGRPPYPVEAMWRVILSKYLLGIRFNCDLIQRLRTDTRLRELCGLGDRVPSESMVSRFFGRLSAHQDLVDQATRDLVRKLARQIDYRTDIWDHPVGAMIAIDSTDVPTFANPNRDPPTDPDARWGHKNSARKRDGTDAIEYVYGYKVHLICDAVYGIPLAYIILPANASDSRQLPGLVRQLFDEQPWVEPQWMLADKGYDANTSYQFLDDLMIDPIILMRDTYKHGDLYDSKGRPICLGGVPMEYLETDPEQGHRFRCPPEGCHLKNQLAFSLYCADECYELPEGELLRKVGRVARASQGFKDLYSHRQTIERFFGSAKHSRLLAEHRYRSLIKISLHVALSILTYLVTMLNKVLACRMSELRHMRIRLPKLQDVDVQETAERKQVKRVTVLQATRSRRQMREKPSKHLLNVGRH